MTHSTEDTICSRVLGPANVAAWIRNPMQGIDLCRRRDKCQIQDVRLTQLVVVSSELGSSWVHLRFASRMMSASVSFSLKFCALS